MTIILILVILLLLSSRINYLQHVDIVLLKKNIHFFKKSKGDRTILFLSLHNQISKIVQERIYLETMLQDITEKYNYCVENSFLLDRINQKCKRIQELFRINIQALPPGNKTNSGHLFPPSPNTTNGTDYLETPAPWLDSNGETPTT